MRLSKVLFNCIRDVGAKLGGNHGQMAVEFVAMLPVVLVIASFALYGLTYVHACSVFDAAFRDSVRFHNEEGNPSPDSSDLIKEDLTGSLQEDAHMSVSGNDVTVEVLNLGLGHKKYRATVTLSPEVFPLPFSRVFDVVVPDISHQCQLVISEHRYAVLV